VAEEAGETTELEQGFDEERVDDGEWEFDVAVVAGAVHLALLTRLTEPSTVRRTWKQNNNT